MRHRILILLFLGGLMALAGCKEMPGLISHNIVLGEAEHGKKLYKGAKDCTACHGVNLKGQGYIPGCFGCHGVMWNKDDHLVKLGSTMHKRGYLDAPNNCGPCHGGTSLKKENIQGKLRPGCYDCHGDKWTGIASHSISKGGYLHATGLTDPTNTGCTSCHGTDLKGSTAPSCYTCHGALWLYASTPHNVVKDGYKHAAGLNSPSANCVDCHGADLRGGIGPSCYACHGAEWSGGGDDKLLNLIRGQ